jgi:outer membrane protein TolC
MDTRRVTRERFRVILSLSKDRRKSLAFAAAALSVLISTAPLAAQPTQRNLPKAATIPSPEPTPVTPVVPAVAPGYSAPNVRPTAAEVVGVTQQPFVGIALPDAIGMALLKNQDLAVSAGQTRIATYQIQEAKGAYDVHFFVEPSWKHDNSAPQNAFFSGGPGFQPIVQNYQTVQGGFQGAIPGGGQYNVNVSQTKANDNTFINAFNPYYLASLNVSVSQPLLKGFGPNSDIRRQIRLSLVNADQSQAAALAQASATIASVEDAYWNLVAGWRNVAIQENALRQSVLQQQSNVRMAKRGAAAPIDAIESSTQVAVYQENVFSALQTVSTLQNQLKSLVVTDPSDPIWRANLVPTTPVLEAPQQPSLRQLLADAMKNRPEIREALDTKKSADINLAYAHNQMLPQADLQLTYNGNGFAGSALPPLGPPFGTATPPPYLHGAYGRAYGNIGKFPAYSAGVQISFPIGNNTARGALSAANEQERIARIQSTGVGQRIQYEVYNALQNYESALARLYSARRARENAAAVLASEERKFRNGESTTFLVDQREVEYVQNEGLELSAQTDLNQAIVELQRVDGSILSANNVTLSTMGSGLKL